MIFLNNPNNPVGKVSSVTYVIPEFCISQNSSRFIELSILNLSYPLIDVRIEHLYEIFVN